MATTEILTVTTQFTPLDLLLWRRFRSEATGRVERTIALNPGVCESVFLPIGSQVTVEIPDPTAAPVLPVVPLWS
jgi:phage tail protein X